MLPNDDIQECCRTTTFEWDEGEVHEISSVPRYSRWWWDCAPVHLVVSYAVWMKNIIRAFTTNR